MNVNSDIRLVYNSVFIQKQVISILQPFVWTIYRYICITVGWSRAARLYSAVGTRIIRKCYITLSQLRKHFENGKLLVTVCHNDQYNVYLYNEIELI